MATAHTHPPHAHQASPEHLASGDREATNSPLSTTAHKSVVNRTFLYAIPVLIVLALVIYLASNSRVGPSTTAQNPLSASPASASGAMDGSATPTTTPAQ